MGGAEGHVEWFDNVNRNFGVGNVKIKDGVYHAGNWTARALHECSIPPHDINQSNIKFYSHKWDKLAK
jgi:hypothetical protein